MWKEILYVGIGGGMGSILRFLTSKIMAHYARANLLFLGTFAANVIGCFLIGIFAGWMLANQPENQSFRLLFIVGFCGGYTTFRLSRSKIFDYWNRTMVAVFRLHAVKHCLRNFCRLGGDENNKLNLCWKNAPCGLKPHSA